jgi:ribose transport system substrate-binding protein
MAVAIDLPLAMLRAGKACATCKMLEYVSTPVGSGNQNMPGLFTSWVQKYPDPFYVYTVSDAGFFDPGVPALRTGGVAPTGRVSLIGSDGSPAAYQRIKTGEYELGTIPEPAALQGWQAIDELNRAINGAPPSGFVQPLHIITHDNVGSDINADGRRDRWPGNAYQPGCHRHQILDWDRRRPCRHAEEA